MMAGDDGNNIRCNALDTSKAMAEGGAVGAVEGFFGGAVYGSAAGGPGAVAGAIGGAGVGFGVGSIGAGAKHIYSNCSFFKQEGDKQENGAELGDAAFPGNFNPNG